jgi:hypothetical protein
MSSKVGGRKKGTPNKLPAQAKENIIAVFTRLGGTSQMADWARENLTEFYKLYGKLIPVENKHSGSEDGAAMKHAVTITIVDHRPDDQR